MVFLLLVAQASAQVPIAAPEPGRDVVDERQGGDLGLGIAIGAPAGLAGKLWFGDWTAVQFSAGGDLGRVGDVAVTADYLVHFRPIVTGSEDYSMPLHVGAGVNMSANLWELSGAVLLGPRAVFGADVLVRDLPVDLFVDIAPTFYIYEQLTWSVDGQIGMRYYF